MPVVSKRFVSTLSLAAAAVLALAPAVLAHGFEKGSLKIGHPWTRATPAGAAVGAGYLTITNGGAEADKLTGASFEGAGSVEVHEMKTDDKGVMTMRHITDGLVVAPGATVEFKPESFHLMLMGLKAPIATGPNVKGSLTFEKAGTVDIEFKVEPVGAPESGEHKH
jgi:periplasmic copper chaperone A